MPVKQDKKPQNKAVKISGSTYDLVVAEALRLGVREGRMVTLQEVLDKELQASLSGKPKPELKE